MTRKTSFARLLQRFARHDDGAVAIIVALALPVTIGMAALVEASRVYIVKNQLQITADAAAMASVKQVPSSAAVTSTARAPAAHACTTAPARSASESTVPLKRTRPRHASREGWVSFSRDPRQADEVIARAVGYNSP